MLQLFAWPELTLPFTAGAVCSSNRNRPGAWSCTARSVSAPERGRPRPTGPFEKKIASRNQQPIEKAQNREIERFQSTTISRTWPDPRFRRRSDLVSFSLRFRFARNILSQNGTTGGAQKFAKTPHRRKGLFSPPNSLKRNKTAKEMFAKIWRKQAKICENLHKKLGALPILERGECAAAGRRGSP